MPHLQPFCSTRPLKLPFEQKSSLHPSIWWLGQVPQYCMQMRLFSGLFSTNIFSPDHLQDIINNLIYIKSILSDNGNVGLPLPTWEYSLGRIPGPRVSRGDMAGSKWIWKLYAAIRHIDCRIESLFYLCFRKICDYKALHRQYWNNNTLLRIMPDYLDPEVCSAADRYYFAIIARYYRSNSECHEKNRVNFL